MRLTPEEIQTVTAYLISVLKRKRFSVHINRYGNILYVEKFGIRCCPAILNSLEDGRHGYAYIQLITNPYSEKDLGSYYKPRTNKDNHKLFDKNDSVDKYAGKNIHIDMHNYKQVIETFAKDLNKDYTRITRRVEDLDLLSTDEGTCKYKINPTTNIGWWHISADNQNLKAAIVNALKEVFNVVEGPSLYPCNYVYGMDREGLDDLNSEHSMLKCDWDVSEPHHGHIVLAVLNPNKTLEDKYFIGSGYGSAEVSECIDNWVKSHQTNENLTESIVKIKNTGTVFDGMTGTVETDDGNKLTVLVNFNGERKVRNKFKKENIEILED